MTDPVHMAAELNPTLPIQDHDQLRAALRAIRTRNPKKLVLAVPVAPTETVAALREEADDVVCLEDHESFGAIGYYYADFSQVSDQEVIGILARFPVPKPDSQLPTL